MICPKCGNTLKDTAKFCGKCGTKLTPVAPKAPEPVPEPVPETVAEPVQPVPETPLEPAPKVPEPISEPAPEPAPEPVPEPAPEPAKQDNPPPKEPIIIPPITAVMPAMAATPDTLSTPQKKGSPLPLILGVGAGVLVIVGVILTIVFLTSGPKIEDFLNENIQYGKFMDTRDSAEYYTVEINGQKWLAQNLNYGTPSSICDTCALYGRIYTYDDAQNACPDGWTLPSYADVQAVLAELSANDLFSAKQGGTDKFGFSALMAGFYSQTTSDIRRRGEMLGFWLKDETGDFAMRAKLETGSLDVSALKKTYGLSVRCISATSSIYNDDTKMLIDNRDARVYKTVKVGERRWMAQNLKRRAKNAFCYEEDSTNCDVYGRMYDFETAKTICPEGWRLPDTADVMALKQESELLKLDVKFAGFRDAKGVYDLMGVRADYWMDSERRKKGVYWFMSSQTSDVQIASFAKEAAMSVRCVEITAEELEDMRAEQERAEIEAADRAALQQKRAAENSEYVAQRHSEDDEELAERRRIAEEERAEMRRRAEEERAEKRRIEEEDRAARDAEEEEAPRAKQSVSAVVKIATEKGIRINYDGYDVIFTPGDVNEVLKKNKAQIQSIYQNLLNSRDPFEAMIKFRLTVDVSSGKIIDVEDISGQASMSEDGHGILFRQLSVMMRLRVKLPPQDASDRAYVEFPLKFVYE